MILIIWLIVISHIYPQVSEGWRDVCTTAVATRQGERLAMFANHHGIHVLQSTINGDALKYFRFKSDGTLDDGITTSGITIDASCKYPNLVGDESNIFAIYQNGSYIIIKKSTDGGNNWANETTYPFLISTE